MYAGPSSSFTLDVGENLTLVKFIIRRYIFSLMKQTRMRFVPLGFLVFLASFTMVRSSVIYSDGPLIASASMVHNTRNRGGACFSFQSRQEKSLWSYLSVATNHPENNSHSLLESSQADARPKKYEGYNRDHHVGPTADNGYHWWWYYKEDDETDDENEEDVCHEHDADEMV